MSKIILQPTSNKVAYEHYVNTILNPVSAECIKKHVDESIYKSILEQYPSGEVYVWGVKNGKNNVNKNKWKKISRGDITLFAQQGGIFSSAVTTMTFCSKSLAEELWGVDKDGDTWENIYLIEDVKNITIPYEVLNPLLEYSEGNIIQGFNVLSQEKSDRLGLKYDLFSKDICEVISEHDYRDYVIELDDGTDLNVEGVSYGRREQSFLRNYLFGRKRSFICGICGRTLPVNMLITAHIKKRSECSVSEKLDYENIVMPMCKFGCDDLYEKGYIYIQDGQVKINEQKWITDDLREELKKIEGRKCDYYNENTEPYFAAHRKKYGI